MRNIDNPPIIDSLALIGFDRSFSEEETSSLHASIERMGYFTSPQLAFKLDGSEKFQPKAFTSEDGESEFIVRANAILYRDGRRYVNRHRFLEKIHHLWEEASLEKLADNIKDIRLRAVNKFICSIEDIGHSILVYTNVNTERGGLLLGYSSAKVHLRSEYYSANAVINFKAQPLQSEMLEIILDIDTYSENESVVDFQSVQSIFFKLADFRNDLFFGNVIDAKERFRPNA